MPMSEPDDVGVADLVTVMCDRRVGDEGEYIHHAHALEDFRRISTPGR